MHIHMAPGICPICRDKLHVQRLACSSCKSALEGIFELCKFCYLTKEHKDFIEIFIKCSGNIKEVGKELGISYPTVKSRLQDVIDSMGYKDIQAQYEREEDQSIQKQVLEQLSRGDITAEEAIQILDEK